jgi:sister chromatid cohesion protein DCC1
MPDEAFVDGEFTTRDGEAFNLEFDPAGVDRDDIELLEIDPGVLNEILKSDGSIAFKGGPDDVAVVCTKTKTYQVRRVETSNQILLVGPSLDGGETTTKTTKTTTVVTETQPTDEAPTKRATVRAQKSSHLDLTEIAPRLDRLRDMLASVAYGVGGAMETDAMETDDAAGYAFEELDENVQASEMEIMRCLEDEHALCVDGKWRGVDAGYRLHALSMLAVTIGGNGWMTSAVPEDDVVATMTADGFIREVVLNTLQAFGDRNDDGATWCLDEKRVCRAMLEPIVRSGVGVKQWRLSEVMETLNAKLAEVSLDSMAAKEEYLSGLALIERPDRANEAFVTTLIASELPTEPADRFRALWEAKPKWTLAELEPYLEGQARPGQTIESQLLKFCRVTSGDPPIYSKR